MLLICANYEACFYTKQAFIFVGQAFEWRLDYSSSDCRVLFGSLVLLITAF